MVEIDFSAAFAAELERHEARIVTEAIQKESEIWMEEGDDGAITLRIVVTEGGWEQSDGDLLQGPYVPLSKIVEHFLAGHDDPETLDAFAEELERTAAMVRRKAGD